MNGLYENKKDFEIVLRIENTSDITSYTCLDLFKTTNGGVLSSDIRVTIDLIEDGKPRGISYKQLCSQVVVQPIPVQVVSTSDNRLIDFLWMSVWGEQRGMEPCLTIDGNKRPEKYNKFTDEIDYVVEWDPKVWNIADTHEQYIWDLKIFYRLALKKLSWFEIRFKRINNVVVG